MPPKAQTITPPDQTLTIRPVRNNSSLQQRRASEQSQQKPAKQEVVLRAKRAASRQLSSFSRSRSDQRQALVMGTIQAQKTLADLGRPPTGQVANPFSTLCQKENNQNAVNVNAEASKRKSSHQGL